MNYPEVIYADTDLVCGEESKSGHAKYIRANSGLPCVITFNQSSRFDYTKLRSQTGVKVCDVLPMKP